MAIRSRLLTTCYKVKPRTLLQERWLIFERDNELIFAGFGVIGNIFDNLKVKLHGFIKFFATEIFHSSVGGLPLTQLLYSHQQ